MPAKIALQSGQASPPLDNLTHSRRGQGTADPLFPEPPEDRPFGDPGCVQPVLQGEGGPIEHRLVRGRGGRNPRLLGLTVLQPVDIARLANPAQVAQVGSGDQGAIPNSLTGSILSKRTRIEKTDKNRRKRPSGGACAGYVSLRIMYIMFKAD